MAEYFTKIYVFKLRIFDQYYFDRSPAVSRGKDFLIKIFGIIFPKNVDDRFKEITRRK